MASTTGTSPSQAATKAVLRGHKGAVLCAEVHPTDEAVVVTGSEDATLRIWDLRTSRSKRHVSAFMGSQAVATCAFHPVTPHRLFLACGSTVYEADLRSPHILLKEAVNTATVAKDEINQLVFDASGDFIATADDSGMVSVLEADTLEVMQGIGAHDSLAACVAFTEAGELLSGGYDATIRVSDVMEGTVDDCIPTADADGASNQVVNPPFVNSLAVAADGTRFAAGLGDGCCLVCDYETFSPVARVAGHSKGVASTRFSATDPTQLFSGGTDGVVLRWSLIDAKSLRQAAAAAVTPADTKVEEGEGDGDEENPSTSEAATTPSVGVVANLKIAHGDKINWMCTSSYLGESIVVCDTSSEASVYCGLRRP